MTDLRDRVAIVTGGGRPGWRSGQRILATEWTDLG
jgi:hypothetical protein